VTNLDNIIVYNGIINSEFRIFLGDKKYKLIFINNNESLVFENLKKIIDYIFIKLKNN